MKDSELVTAAGRGNLRAIHIRQDWKSAVTEQGGESGKVRVQCYRNHLQFNVLIKIALLYSTATSTLDAFTRPVT